MIDLHTHSAASDGTLSPSALIDLAVKRGLSAVALTDHDTIEGNAEAASAAAALNLRFMPGIELEIKWNNGGEFHLLGLGIDNPSPGFLATMAEIARRRQERNMEIVEKMNRAGIVTSYDEVISLSGAKNARGHSIGRPHFATFLTKRKVVKSREQAFLRYLAKGKPFYIPKEALDFERAVGIIHESGGIAILAHPMSLFVSWGRLPDLIKDFKEKGLDGLEAWHPAAKVSHCRRFEALGKKLELRITAGSDFHGEASPDRKLGITAGGKKIDDSYWPAV